MYSNISVKDNKQKRQSINILLIDTVKLQLNNRHPKRSECVLNEKLTINNGRSLFKVFLTLENTYGKLYIIL